MLKRFALLILLAFIYIPEAHARVDMVPHIVIFEPRERSSEITILNLSDETREFRLKIINYKQTPPRGSYQILEGPLDPAFDPDQVVRFSPRTFTLAPKGLQKVRLSLRKPGDLPDGEYRFHLLATSYATEEESRPSNDNVSIVMAMNVGIAIPVIVRHGNVSSTGQLSDFDLRPGSQTQSKKPELHFLASRSGNSSTVGRISVAWAQDGRNFEEIGFIRNFNVFTELQEREGRVVLDKFPTSGVMKVTYFEDTQNKTLYDEIVFDL